MLKKTILLMVLPFYLWGFTISENKVLTEDVTYNEDVIVDGAILNLNGYTLTINGDLNITGTNARLKMILNSSKLIVKRNLTFSGASTYKDLTKGVIELAGNFSQIGNNFHKDHLSDTDTVWNNHTRYYADNEYSFYPTHEHKVILNGNSKQTIYFQAPNHSRFNNLEIQNSSDEGIIFKQLNVLGEWKRNDSHVVINDIRNLTLTENYTISNDVNVTGGILNLNGFTLTINGNLKFLNANCRLQMKNSNDRLIIKNNLTFSGASTYQDLTDGTIELQGNFYQLGNNFHRDHLSDTDTLWNNHTRYSANNEYSFYPTGNHKVLLNGTSTQRVVFDSADHSRFANLEIENEDVIFNLDNGSKIKVVSDLYISKSLYTNVYKNHSLLTFNRYRDINKVYLKLERGLYLTALPIKNSLNKEEIKSIFSDVNMSYVLKYDAYNNKWKGFSNSSIISKKMKDAKVEELTTINAGEGIFIDTENDVELKFPSSEGYELFDRVEVSNLSSGWHLLGSNKIFNLNKLLDINSNIKVIWMYQNSKWHYFTREEKIKEEYMRREIAEFSDLNTTNSGFWIYVE